MQEWLLNKYIIQFTVVKRAHENIPSSIQTICIPWLKFKWCVWNWYPKEQSNSSCREKYTKDPSAIGTLVLLWNFLFSTVLLPGILTHFFKPCSVPFVDDLLTRFTGHPLRVSSSWVQKLIKLDLSDAIGAPYNPGVLHLQRWSPKFNNIHSVAVICV